jgi:hypothetical protein
MGKHRTQYHPQQKIEQARLRNDSPHSAQHEHAVEAPPSGGLRYHNYRNALAWRPYPQKIAIGSRSISRSRSLISGDGSSWSYRWKRRLRSRQYNVHILVAWV